MIAARHTQDERTFVTRLANKAGRLARARAEERLRASRNDSRRWRMARLLWPLF